MNTLQMTQEAAPVTIVRRTAQRVAEAESREIGSLPAPLACSALSQPLLASSASCGDGIATRMGLNSMSTGKSGNHPHQPIVRLWIIAVLVFVQALLMNGPAPATGTHADLCARPVLTVSGLTSFNRRGMISGLDIDRSTFASTQGLGVSMTSLAEIIGSLIATGKEGDHWDFKRKHHERAGDLIKDVICLANSPRHQGDRYIIFGVSDDGSVIGLDPDASQRTQADIVNTLTGAGFAGGVYPDIHLEGVTIQGRRLGVLTIKDRAEKPYFLQRRYDSSGVRLNPGTIYSRVRDSNTPSDQVASLHDIEKMWRERFGLDKTPFQRVQDYLVNPAAWTKTSDYTWHHSQFPEFTVAPTEDEAPAVDGGHNWVRVPPNPNAFVRLLKICFHQTVLAEVPCILYDETREVMPAPTAMHFHHEPELWFYWLSSGTLEFRLLRFLTLAGWDDFVRYGLTGRKLGVKVPVVLFSSSEERFEFEKYVKQNLQQILENSSSVGGGGLELSDVDQRIIWFSKLINDQLEEWRLQRDVKERAPLEV